MRIAVLCAAMLAIAGCNQEAVANLGKCQSDLDKAKSDLAAANNAKQAAESRVTSL